MSTLITLVIIALIVAFACTNIQSWNAINRMDELEGRYIWKADDSDAELFFKQYNPDTDMVIFEQVTGGATYRVTYKTMQQLIETGLLVKVEE